MQGCQIKLRAWCPKNREMYFSDDNYHFRIYSNCIGYYPNSEYEDLQHYNTDPSSDEELICVMESTALKDKNNEEIYENDLVLFMGGTVPILRCGNYEDQFHNIGTLLQVQKLKSGFTLRLPKHCEENSISNQVGNVDNYDFWNHHLSLEKVGNIYQHPCLLK